MKNKNIQPQVSAPVQRPTTSIINAQPNGGGSSVPLAVNHLIFAGDDAE
jgi:prenylated cyclic peptide (anacyclamide/piricyclamide family)